jgi:hypothetical protein
MGIKDIISRIRERNSKYSVMEDEFKAQKKLQERQLSSNERELNSILEEERQERIKKILEMKKKKENDEMWHGKTMLDSPNIFNDQHNMLKEKSLFDKKDNLFTNKKSVYLKK